MCSGHGFNELPTSAGTRQEWSRLGCWMEVENGALGTFIIGLILLKQFRKVEKIFLIAVPQNF